MMKINLTQLIDEYPLSYEAIAVSMGISRQALHKFDKRNTVKRPELNRKHYLAIQNHLQACGKAMSSRSDTDPLTEILFKSWPLSLTAFSIYMGQHRFWLRNSLHANSLTTGETALVNIALRQIGSILSDLVLLDFIEHDYVAQHLLNQKKFNGVIV